MPVIVDQETLDAQSPGLATVGQVLGRIRQSRRLVVRLVIDGEAPDLRDMQAVNAIVIGDRTVYIETVDPVQASLETLDQLDSQFPSADKLKSEAADLLRANQWNPAMEKLSQCLVCWQQAQQTVVAISRLFQLDLDGLVVEGVPLAELSAQFAAQLRDIQTAVQSADLVALTDLLAYDTADTGKQWRAALKSVRNNISQKRPVQSAA